MAELRASAGEGAKRHARSGMIVYEALSRRAGGLSLGVNLFPDGKRCSFDCAYCEVGPAAGALPFSLSAFEEELETWARRAAAEGRRPVDIAFAGDGEPCLSPELGPALGLAAEARRRRPGLLGSAKLVLITNSTGFLDPGTAEVLHGFVAGEGLEIWAKLDAGSESWYRRMNRRGPPFEALLEGLLSFSRRSPLLVQSLWCSLAPGPGRKPEAPPEGEIRAFASLLLRLLEGGAKIGELQLYTQSRPAPLGLTAPLSDGELLALAATCVDEAAGRALPPLRLFGAAGELAFPGGSP